MSAINDFNRIPTNKDLENIASNLDESKEIFINNSSSMVGRTYVWLTGLTNTIPRWVVDYIEKHRELEKAIQQKGPGEVPESVIQSLEKSRETIHKLSRVVNHLALVAYFEGKEKQELICSVSEGEKNNYDSVIGSLDCHIDNIFSGVSLPPGSHTIMVHVREDNGMGDIMLAVKTIKGLKEQFPELNIQCSVETRTIKIENALDLIGKEVSSMLGGGALFAYNKRPENLMDPEIIISMPDDPPPEIDDLWMGQFKNPPERLLLKEYGWGNPLESGGLSPSSFGIFLEKSLTGLESTNTDGEIIANMQNQQMSGIILGGKKPEKYATDTKLYFGYAHLPAPTAGFVKSMCWVNQENNQNLDFFLRTENLIPGVDWHAEVGKDGITFKERLKGQEYTKDKIDFDELRNLGIGKIEFIKPKRERIKVEIETISGRQTVERFRTIQDKNGNAKMEDKIEINIPEAKGQKTLRIIDGFPIPHADMLILMKGSEPEILVTGNQSFSEAVSAKKIFFYEVVPNDRRLSEQMQGLGETISPELRTAIESMQSYERVMDYKKVANYLSNPNVRSDFVKFGEKIQREFDLKKRLGRKINRLLWASYSPLVKENLKKIDQKIQILIDHRIDKIEAIEGAGRTVRADEKIQTESNEFNNLLESVKPWLAELVLAVV